MFYTIESFGLHNNLRSGKGEASAFSGEIGASVGCRRWPGRSRASQRCAFGWDGTGRVQRKNESVRALFTQPKAGVEVFRLRDRQQRCGAGGGPVGQLTTCSVLGSLGEET